METKMVTSSDNQTTSLDGLMSNMNYLVQVAGVNAEGVGECRNITVTTPQCESHTHISHNTVATQWLCSRWSYNTFTLKSQILMNTTLCILIGT